MAGEQSTLGEQGQALHAGEGVLLVAGEGMLVTHALDKPALVIGRSDECDIVVPNATLSRRHARIVIGPPLTVQDLGSRNGTRIDGQLKKGGQPVTLRPGEAFHIGQVSFVVMRAPRPVDAESAAFERPLKVLDPTFEGASEHVRAIAKSSANVLILGETGVGKEVLADTLHRCSERTGPLVRINCATLSATLLESELFGHEKGAFTGAVEARPGILAAAKGGTVLLDEVGELPPPLQAKLLRALESKEVMRVGASRPVAIDLRFLASTNRNLPGDVARGNFRADLFFRLDGMTLQIPPLRERRDAIVPLALRFCAEARRAAGRPPLALSTAVLDHLMAHDWPGNVRELKAAVERALLLSRTEELRPAHFGLAFDTAAPPPPMGGGAADEVITAEHVRDQPPGADAERARIVAALAECAGNQTRAAQKLGISRATMTVKMSIHRIPRPRR